MKPSLAIDLHCYLQRNTNFHLRFTKFARNERNSRSNVRHGKFEVGVFLGTWIEKMERKKERKEEGKKTGKFEWKGADTAVVLSLRRKLAGRRLAEAARQPSPSFLRRARLFKSFVVAAGYDRSSTEILSSRGDQRATRISRSHRITRRSRGCLSFSRFFSTLDLHGTFVFISRVKTHARCPDRVAVVGCLANFNNVEKNIRNIRISF